MQIKLRANITKTTTRTSRTTTDEKMALSTRSRTRSESPHLSRRERGKTAMSAMRRNPMMFMTRNPAEIINRFTICPEPGCVVSSGVALFDSMTIRTGLSHCMKHVAMTEIEGKLKNPAAAENTVLIFYDIELSRDGEIEQLGACTESGKTFSAFMKTSVRTNSSPYLKMIPPEYWTMLAEEPRVTFARFISWTMAQRQSDSDTVMLAAHYGSCHDHVHLLRSMMKWGLKPPSYRLVDTLAIFKLARGTNMNAKLSTLVNTYAPWFHHVPHDADSDAAGLRLVTMVGFPNTRLICYAFGISSESFMDRTGLSMFMPSPIVTFASGFGNAILTRRNSVDDVASSISSGSRSMI